MARFALETSDDRATTNRGSAGGRWTVIVPAKDAARSIGQVLRRMPPTVDEVILVDGQSTDATVEIARRARPDIRVLVEEQPSIEAALRTGFAAATGDFIVMIDAGGSIDPREIVVQAEGLSIDVPQVLR
jgi:glycosyltransferase involved in cell wall biosynthesis